MQKHFNSSVKELIEDSEESFEKVYDQQFFRQFENLSDDQKEIVRDMIHSMSKRSLKIDRMLIDDAGSDPIKLAKSITNQIIDQESTRGCKTNMCEH